MTSFADAYLDCFHLGGDENVIAGLFPLPLACDNSIRDRYGSSTELLTFCNADQLLDAAGRFDGAGLDLDFDLDLDVEA